MGDKSDNEKSEKIKVYGDDLKILNIWSYGVGHFMNDICASTWFFFLSYYLIKIVQIDKDNASTVLLSGQIADAIATPFVGIVSDKINTKYGKRTPWYFLGTILVAISFSLIFFSLLEEDASENAKLIYYSLFASFFNVGWAMVQVSHMALLPSITLNKKKKDFMTRIRTGFTFTAQLLTLILSIVFFRLITNKILQYQVLAGSSIFLGLIFSAVFMILCKEHILSRNIPKYIENINNKINSINKVSNNSNENKNFISDEKNNDSNDMNSKLLNSNNQQSNDILLISGEENNQDKENNDNQEINWLYWMKKPDFYYYIMVYMFVRLSINITSTMIPFFMEVVLKYQKTAEGGTPYQITVCLLMSTLGSILNSLLLQKFIESKTNEQSKRTALILIAMIFVTIGCLPLYYLSSDLGYLIYILSFIWGIGFSQGLSCASSLTNDVVGSKGSKGAFVYGAFSFADKLSCGIVLKFFLPVAENSEDVLRYTIPFFPPATLVFAVLFVCLRIFITRKNEEAESLNNSDKDEYNSEEANSKSNKNKKTSKSKFRETNNIDDSNLTFVTNHNLSMQSNRKMSNTSY